MASRMHKVYALDLYVKYGGYVKYMSADEKVSIYLPYEELSDPNNLPKLVTVTVEANDHCPKLSGLMESGVWFYAGWSRSGGRSVTVA